MRQRLVGGLVAALIVVVGVLGVPIALLLVGRLDGFAELGRPQWWRLPDDGSLILATITLVGWFAWGLFLASLIDEAIRVRRPGGPTRLPVLSCWSPLTGLLVAAILGLFVPPVAAPQQAVAQPVEPTPAPVLTSGGQNSTAPLSRTSHLVQPGDTLWGLAEHYLGDGMRWREVVEANADILYGGTDIDIGMVLVMPDAAADPPVSTIEVHEGESLWTLSADHLGGGEHWPELWQANAGVIEDPDLIQPGWTLQLPEPLAPPVPGVAPGIDLSGDQSPAVPQPVPDLEVASCPTRDGTEVSGATSQESTRRVDEPDHDGRSSRVGAVLLAAGMSLTLAASGYGAYRWRRDQQLRSRPLGHRMPPLEPGAERLRGLLAGSQIHPVHPVERWRIEIGHQGSRDVLWDFEDAITRIDGDPDDTLAFLAALAARVGSAGSPLRLLLLGDGFGWLASMDEPEMTIVAGEGAAGALDEEIAARRAHLATPGAGVGDLPGLLVLADHPLAPPADLDRLGIRLITVAPAGPGAVITVSAETAIAPSGETFVPNLLREPARRAWSQVFDAAASDAYPTAWWWTDDQEVPDEPARRGREVPTINQVDGEHAHPILRLLGPVELVGARGARPTRAVHQCEEYCAWLLENPGASSATMADRLMVAEATRRSNMSRLRTWLGRDDDGQAYLPEAYSGTIRLHPAITSDWEELRALVCMGVPHASDAVLRAALGLVRGAPLANAAPGQWLWAEELRMDMVSLIRDIGVVLATRTIDRGDLETADWALTRAGWACPKDELILAQQLRLADARQDPDQVQQLVMRLTRSARALGVDLADDTVRIMQQVVEGRVRVRGEAV